MTIDEVAFKRSGGDGAQQRVTTIAKSGAACVVKLAGHGALDAKLAEELRAARAMLAVRHQAKWAPVERGESGA